MSGHRPSSLPEGVTNLMIGAASLGALLTAVEVWWLATHGASTLLLGVTLATATTVPYTALVLWLDRHEKEPPWLLLASFAWGALACTAFSGLVNGLSTTALGALLHDEVVGRQITASLVAPVVEEFTKGGALVVLFSRYRHHTDGVLDGVIYGAIVGMGFAWFENTLYYLQAAGDGFSAVLSLTWVRGVLSGVGTHATFTALTGVGFGVHRALRRGRLRHIAPLAGVTAAMVIHAFWNTGSMWMLGASSSAVTTLMHDAPLAVAVLQLPFTALVLGVTALTWRHQDALIRTYLAAEGPEVVTPDEVTRLVPARRRMASGFRAFRQGGVPGWWQHRVLTQSLVRLAFERWHHEGDERPGDVAHDPRMQRLRARIQRLKQQGVQV